MGVVSIPDAVAISIASQCDRGKIREENQDTARHTRTQLGDLLVVAEGIGGCGVGGQASRMAVDTIWSNVEGMPAFFPPEIAVEEAICHANAAITAAANEPDCPDSRMGATVVVALLRTDANHAYTPVQAIIGHVGDSRAYLVHDQKLTLLTHDHTAEQILPGNNLITPQEPETHPDKSLLTRYLGLGLNVRVEMREAPLEVGDTLLLCSDGLWGYVPEQEIQRVLADGTRSVEEASRALLNLALDAGGHDNVAIEIARLTQSSDAASTAVDAVEPRFEAPPEIEFVGELAPASDTSESDWPNIAAMLQAANSVTGLQPPNREKVLSLIGDRGRRISDKDAIAENQTAAEQAAPSVSGVKPTVSWATPEPIAYGTALSSVQLNATASVHGKFLYTPGPGYILPAGMHMLWVAFSAANSPEDNPVLAEVSIAVSKAAPSIQWPAPADVPAGIALGAAQLNASASVPGTFDYSPTTGEVLSDGTHTLSVTFDPEDKANYTTAHASVSVTVAKTVPKIDWTPPKPVPYGTPLAAAELNASAPVPGAFQYSPASGEVLSAGSHALSVTFIPSDAASYATALATVQLTVTRGTPAIVWPAPEKITYGTALNDTQLNATASVAGTFLYNPSPGAVLAAGEHTPSVVFTPSNLSDYTPTRASVPLSVAKATPAISWPAPDPINSDTPLSSAQHNAGASVPGTFAYLPAAGEALGPGSHTLSVTFTPADSANYTLAQAGVSLTVTEILPAAITWLNPSSISYGTALGDQQLSAGSPVPGSFHYTPAAGDVLPPGEHTLSVTFTPADQGRYARVKAAVTLIVEEHRSLSPVLDRPHETVVQTPAVAPAIQEVQFSAPPPDRAAAATARNATPAPLAAAPAEIDEVLLNFFQAGTPESKPVRKRWPIIAGASAALVVILAAAMIPVLSHSTSSSVKPVAAPEPAATVMQQPEDATRKPALLTPAMPKPTQPAAAASHPQQSSDASPASDQENAGPSPAQAQMMNDQLTAAAQIHRPAALAEQAPPPSGSLAAAGLAGSGNMYASGNNDAIKSALGSANQPTVRAASSKAVTVSPGVAFGLLIHKTPPVYPRIAKDSQISGTVVLSAHISKDGTVDDLRVISGPPMLRQSAVDAVRTWRYNPLKVNNQPTAIETTIDVRFSLD